MLFLSSIALTALLLPFGLVSSAPVATNGTDPGVDVPISINVASEHGVDCLHYPEVDASGRGRIFIKCTVVPDGVEVRGAWKTAEMATANEAVTDWFYDSNAHYSDWRSSAKGLDTKIEYQLRNDASKGDCEVNRQWNQPPIFADDMYRVHLKCRKLAAQVKAQGVMKRGIFDGDIHTAWMEGPIQGIKSIASEWARPSFLVSHDRFSH